jgi:hypothetical protein
MTIYEGVVERRATTRTALWHAATTSQRARAWAAVAAAWALSRLLVFATAILVQTQRWPHGRWTDALLGRHLAVLTAWDGRWYRMVASRGYLAIPRHQSDTAFFPLYPALLRGAHATGVSLDTAGLAVSAGALLVGLVALYELARCWCDERTARRAAVYAAIFPVGYAERQNQQNRLGAREPGKRRGDCGSCPATPIREESGRRDRGENQRLRVDHREDVSAPGAPARARSASRR